VHDFLESPLGLWIRVLPLLFLSPYLLSSGIWPNRDEPRKRYDRAIRILGGILFGSGALLGSVSSARIPGSFGVMNNPRPSTVGASFLASPSQAPRKPDVIWVNLNRSAAHASAVHSKMLSRVYD